MASANGRKINWHQSRDIAKGISEKAFEHLVNPVGLQIAQVVEAAMRIDFIGRNAPLLLTAKLLYPADGYITVAVFPVSYEVPEGHSLITAAGRFGFRECGHKLLQIYDDRAYELLLPLVTQRNELAAKQSALYGVLNQQIEGKTAGAVRKAWPEATEIIDKVLGESSGVQLTQPLEQLLARFLPMLPAPQPETEGA